MSGRYFDLCINELDVKKLWHATLDNLNYHIKYAKNLPEGSTGASKMLNLITGQVSHENHVKPQANKQPNNPSTLSEIVLKSESVQIHSQIVTKSAQLVNVDDCINHPKTNENY